jgi:hypothetical protein
MSTPPDIDPAALGREVAQLETETARLEVDRATLAGNVSRLSRRQRYLRLARWIRRPAASMPVFPLILLGIGPLVLGVALVIVLSFLIGSWAISFGGLLIGLFGGLVALAALLFQPASSELERVLAENEAALTSESAKLREATAAAAESKSRLAELHGHRQSLAQSDQLQRAMLLQRNWKTLRGGEWEDYIVEVCRTLGANVQRGDKMGIADLLGPSAGARGVIRYEPTTLFVTFSPRRIAVAAITDVNPFHAAAVRQMVDALAQKGCDELGIVTNARVTEGSREYARSRRCTLIGLEEFPDFVLGKMPL